MPVLWLCISPRHGETGFPVICTRYGRRSRAFDVAGRQAEHSPHAAGPRGWFASQGAGVTAPPKPCRQVRNPERKPHSVRARARSAERLHVHLLVLTTTVPRSSQTARPRGSLCVPTPRGWPSSPFPGLPGHLIIIPCVTHSLVFPVACAPRGSSLTQTRRSPSAGAQSVFVLGRLLRGGGPGALSRPPIPR